MNHTLIVVSVAIATLAGTVTVAPAQAPEDETTQASRLLIGGELPNRETSPEFDDLFDEMNLGAVRLTGGGYDWAVEPHRYGLDKMRERGVKVWLQLGSHWPDGSYNALTGSYLVDHNGETGVVEDWAVKVSGHGWPQYSYVSDEFRQKLAQDFPRYLERVERRPHIAALILHNEPGYFWQADRVFDYNPHALAWFRQWLGQRYDSIEALNAAWSSNFASFDGVEPPRQLPPVDDVAAWMDWRRANVAMIDDFLKWEIALADEMWPGMPVVTNPSGAIDHWYPIRSGYSLGMADGFDAAGIDIYPTRWTSPHYVAYTMDLTRGAGEGKPIHVLEAETYPAQQFEGLSEAQRADMLRSQMWSMIGHGADVILLWSLDGWLTDGKTYNPRVGAVRETTHLAEMLDLSSFTKRPRDVAVVVDPDLYLLESGEHAMSEMSFIDHAARGLYGAVVDAGWEADVILTDQLRRGATDHYRVLVMSDPAIMDQELADVLTRFIDGGGLVIAQGRFGERDRHGRTLSDPSAFGLREKVEMVESGEGAGEQIDRLIRDRLPELQRMGVSFDGETTVDAQTMTNPAGDRVITLAVPSDHGKALAPAENVRVTLPAEWAGDATEAWIVRPVVEEGGRASQVPERVEVARDSARAALDVGRVASVAVVLVPEQGTTLLGFSAPMQVGQDQPGTATVTIINRSGSPISGTLQLLAGPKGEPLGEAQNVSIESGQSSDIELPFDASNLTGRTPIKARLTPAEGRPVVSVPVDVQVER